MNVKNSNNWYLRTWVQSTTSFSFYQNLKNTSVSSAVLFTTIFYGVLAVFYSGVFIYNTLPDVRQLIASIPKTVQERLVPESSLSWDGTTLLLEPTQTLEIALPPSLQSEKSTFTFALTEQGSQELLLRFSGQEQSVSFADILGSDAFVLTKEQLTSNLETTAANLIKLLGILQYFFPILFLVSFGISRGLFVLIETTLLYFILRIYRQPKDFSQLLKLTLHILVLAEIINQWSMRIAPNAPFSMLSLAFWVLLIAILLQQHKHPNREY